MAEIISIDGSKVKIGLDDTKIKTVPLAALQFSKPSVGDEVKLYEDAGEVIVNRVREAKASAGEGARRIGKVLYIVITLLIGVLGVHRFMRGQIGIGILYLLTLGLFSVGVWVDFIISLTKISKYDDEFVFTSHGNWVE